MTRLWWYPAVVPLAVLAAGVVIAATLGEAALRVAAPVLGLPYVAWLAWARPWGRA